VKLKILAPILISLVVGLLFSCKKSSSGGTSSGATASQSSNSCANASTSSVGSLPGVQLALADMTIPDNAVNMNSTSFSPTMPSATLDIDYSALGNNGTTDLSPTYVLWKACSTDGKTCTNNGNWAPSYAFNIDNIPGLPLGVVNVSVKLCVSDSQFLVSSDRSNKCSSDNPCCGKETDFQFLNGSDPTSASPQFTAALTAYQNDQTALLTAASQYISQANSYISSCASSDAGTPGLQYAQNIAAYSSAELAMAVDAYGNDFAQIIAAGAGLSPSQKLNLAANTSSPCTASSSNTSSGTTTDSSSLLSSLLGGSIPSGTDLSTSDTSGFTGGGSSSSGSSSSSGALATNNGSSSSSSSSSTGTPVVPFPTTTNTSTSTNSGKAVLLGVGIVGMMVGVAILAGTGLHYYDGAYNDGKYLRQLMKKIPIYNKKVAEREKTASAFLVNNKNDPGYKRYEGALQRLTEAWNTKIAEQNDVLEKAEATAMQDQQAYEAANKQLIEDKAKLATNQDAAKKIQIEIEQAKTKAGVLADADTNIASGSTKSISQLKSEADLAAKNAKLASDTADQHTKLAAENLKTQYNIDINDALKTNFREYYQLWEETGRGSNLLSSDKQAALDESKAKFYAPIFQNLKEKGAFSNEKYFILKNDDWTFLTQNFNIFNKLATEHIQPWANAAKEVQNEYQLAREAFIEKDPDVISATKKMDPLIADANKSEAKRIDDEETRVDQLKTVSVSSTQGATTAKQDLDKSITALANVQAHYPTVNQTTRALQVADPNHSGGFRTITVEEAVNLSKKTPIVGGDDEAVLQKELANVHSETNKTISKGGVVGGLVGIGAGILATVIGATMNLAGSCGNFMGTIAASNEGSMKTLSDTVQSDLQTITQMQMTPSP